LNFYRSHFVDYFVRYLHFAPTLGNCGRNNR
jgi:hypothetical protein